MAVALLHFGVLTPRRFQDLAEVVGCRLTTKSTKRNTAKFIRIHNSTHGALTPPQAPGAQHLLQAGQREVGATGAVGRRGPPQRCAFSQIQPCSAVNTPKKIKQTRWSSAKQCPNKGRLHVHLFICSYIHVFRYLYVRIFICSYGHMFHSWSFVLMDVPIIPLLGKLSPVFRILTTSLRRNDLLSCQIGGQKSRKFHLTQTPPGISVSSCTRWPVLMGTCLLPLHSLICLQLGIFFNKQCRSAGRRERKQVRTEGRGGGQIPGGETHGGANDCGSFLTANTRQPPATPGNLRQRRRQCPAQGGHPGRGPGPPGRAPGGTARRGETAAPRPAVGWSPAS